MADSFTGYRSGWLKRFLLFGFSLMLLLLVLPAQKTEATHVMGGDITYEWVSGNTYIIRLKFYRFCNSDAGAPGFANSNGGTQPMPTVRATSASCGRNITITLNPVPNTGSEVTPICPAELVNSQCLNRNNPIPGVQEYVYEATITLPAQCADWRFQYAVRNRNTSTNIQNSDNEVFYIEATLNNLVAQNNSSPEFSTLPVPFVCNNAPFSFSHSGVDPNGDSLVYTNIVPMATGLTGTFNPQPNLNNVYNLTYNGGYNLTQPIAAGGTFTFNQGNGQMNFTPNGIQTCVVAVRVDQYRNGVLIGSSMRDIQFTIINCTNSAPAPPQIQNPTGGIISNSTTVTVCYNSQITYTLNFSDPNPQDVLSLLTDVATAIPGASLTTSGTNPMTATFSWVPTFNDVGTHSFTVTVRDNGCPINSVQTYTINVIVQPVSPNEAPQVSVTTPRCRGQNSTVTYSGPALPPGTTYNWTFGGGAIVSGSGAGPYQISWNTLGPKTVTLQTVLSPCTSQVRTVTVNIVKPTTQITGQTASTCPGVNNGTVTLSASGSVAPYTFSANGGAFVAGPTLTGLPPGNNTIVTRDAAGCTDTLQVNILENPPLTITRQNDTSFCQGGSVVLRINGTGGNPAYSYEWRSLTNTLLGSSQTLSVSPTTTTSYVAIFRDACNTTLRDTIVVNVFPPMALAALKDTTICTGAPYTIRTSVTNPVGNVTYAWVNNTTGSVVGNGPTLTVNPATTTTYTLSVNDQCVTRTRNVTVTVYPTTLRFQSASISPNRSFCPGEQATFSVQATGGSGTYSYTWSNGRTGASIIETIPPGGLSLTATIRDACGTRDTTLSATMYPPAVATGRPDTTVCNGATVTLRGTTTGGTGTFSNPTWRVLGGAVIANGNIASVTLNTTTSYVFSAVSGCGNLTVSDTVTVTVFDPLVLGPLPDTLFCFGQPLTYTAQPVFPNLPPTTYTWRNATTNTVLGNGPSLTITPTDTLVISLTATNSCTATPVVVTGLVEVIEPTLDITGLSITPSTTICINNSATLTATVQGGTGAYTYQWTGGGNTASITRSFADTTQVTLTVTDGCQTLDTTVTVFTLPALTVNAGADAIICEGASTELFAAPDGSTGIVTAYTWRDNQGNVVGNTQLVNVAPTVTTTYTITVTDDCGGSALDSVTVFVTLLPRQSAGPDLELCRNSCINLQGSLQNATGVTYRWEPADQILTLNTLTPRVCPIVDTRFILYAERDGCPSEPDTMWVRILERPVATIDTNLLSFCSGFPGVVLPGSGTGGNGNLTYQWLPSIGLNNANIAQPLAQPVQTTTYRLIVRDAKGCVSDTASIVVRVDPIPRANAGPNQFFCQGSAGARLNGTGVGGGFNSYNYQWIPSTGLSNPNDPNPLATPNVTTTYRLIVTNRVTGCVSTNNDTLSQVTVTVIGSPTADAGPPSVSLCLGESIRLGAPPSGGVAPYTYLWSPSTGLSDSTVLQPLATPPHTIKYFLRVTGGGCSSIVDSITVNVKPLPTVDVPDFTTTCANQPVQLSVLVAGGNSPILYEWSPSAGLSATNIPNPVATVSQSTKFYCRVNADGCQGPVIDSILVNVLPTPVVDADTTNQPSRYQLCLGQGVQLAGRVASSVFARYQWSPATGLSDPDILRPIATPSVTTTYYLWAQGGDCQTVDSVRVTVFNPAEANTTADTTTVCEGQSVTLSSLTSVNATQVSWSPAAGIANPNATTITVTPAASQTYYLDVQNGPCTDRDSIRIEVLPQPSAGFDLSATQGCEPLYVSLVNTSSANTTYISWDFGDGTAAANEPNPTHRYLQAGTYTIRQIVAGGNGCLDTAFRTVTNLYDPANPTVIRAQVLPSVPSQLILPFADVQFRDSTTGAVSHLWRFGDGASATTANATHTYPAPGTYTAELVVSDALGCTFTKSFGPITVTAPELEIPNVFTPNGDGIQDEWQVRYTGLLPVQLTIFDRWGNELYAGTQPVWNGLDASGSQVVEGVYFYVIEVGEKRYKGSLTLLR